MFRAWLRVARPDDWTGAVAKAGAMLGTVLIALIPVLARLPGGWVDAALGQEWALRGVLVLVTVWLLMQLRALVYAGLPRAVVLLAGRVRVPDRLRGRWIHIDEIAAVHVDRRPIGEVFVLELQDGSEVDMCPVACEGAGRVYTRLAGRVRRRRQRRELRARKAAGAEG